MRVLYIIHHNVSIFDDNTSNDFIFWKRFWLIDMVTWWLYYNYWNSNRGIVI